MGKNPTWTGLSDQAQLKKGVGFYQKSELEAPFLKLREDPGGAEIYVMMERKRIHNYKYNIAKPFPCK